jgi:hypothetical protein
VELADKEERKPDGPQTYCDHVFSLGTDNILWSLFWKTPSAYISSFIILAITLSALLAPLIAPFDPFNPAQVDLLDAGLPPAGRVVMRVAGQTRLLASGLGVVRHAS